MAEKKLAEGAAPEVQVAEDDFAALLQKEMLAKADQANRIIQLTIDARTHEKNFILYTYLFYFNFMYNNYN